MGEWFVGGSDRMRVLLSLARGFCCLAVFLMLRTAWAFEEFSFEARLPANAGEKAGTITSLWISPDGQLVVLDRGFLKVRVFDPRGNLIREFGRAGGGAGELRQPVDLAVDESGGIYVADAGNHRVEAFDREGRLRFSLGSKGSGPKQFSSPSGVAWANGMLFVSDSGNRRIQRFSDDGVYLGSMGDKTAFRSPGVLRVSARGDIVLLDTDGNRIVVLDGRGKMLRSLGKESGPLAALSDPCGLAVDTAGSIYVSDAGNNKVKKFDSGLELVGVFGSKGDSGPGAFLSPCGIAVNEASRLWVGDRMRQDIQEFTGPPPGRGLTWETVQHSVRFMQSRAVRDDELRGERDAEGNLWELDPHQGKVIRKDQDGNMLLAFGSSGKGEGQFKEPKDVLQHRSGNILVADSGLHRVSIFGKQGMFMAQFGSEGENPGQLLGPVALAEDTTGNILVLEVGNNRVSIFSPTGKFLSTFGRRGSADGEFNRPSDIAITPEGLRIVVDSGNHRVQVFDTSNHHLLSFGSEGKGNGEFLSPARVWSEGPSGVDVVDVDRGTVQTFSLRWVAPPPADVTTVPEGTSVRVAWTDVKAFPIETYFIHRKKAEETRFVKVGSAPSSPFVDEAVSTATTYEYRVEARAADGLHSPWSAPVEIRFALQAARAPAKPKLEPLERAMRLIWEPNLEPAVKLYRIYRGETPNGPFNRIAELPATLYVDLNLAEEQVYYYRVTAVTEAGAESEPGERAFERAKAAAVSKPPLEVVALELHPVFSAHYKIYEREPVGFVRIRNNTKVSIPGIQGSLRIGTLLDSPMQFSITQLGPGEELDQPLRVVFSNRVLNLTAATTIQAEMTISFHEAGAPRKLTENRPLTVYEKHAITWDRTEKIGAFITTGDPIVAELARSIAQQLPPPPHRLPENLVTARYLFEALGVMGVKYVKDPRSPYAKLSEQAEEVDYLRFPRETLQLKGGDCDDLTSLLAALYEAAGIPTYLLDGPGHITLLFDSGISEEEAAEIGLNVSDTVPCRDSVCIPLEVTKIGAEFVTAWSEGSVRFQKWNSKNEAVVIPVNEAWDDYKPSTLDWPSATLAAPAVTDIDRIYPVEVENLAKENADRRAKEYVDRTHKNPSDADAYNKLGVIYASLGFPEEARKQFEWVTQLDPKNAAAHNNLGNVNLANGDYEGALGHYLRARAIDPDDASISLNVAWAKYRLGKKSDAKVEARLAIRKNPKIAEEFEQIVKEVLQ